MSEAALVAPPQAVGARHARRSRTQHGGEHGGEHGGGVHDRQEWVHDNSTPASWMVLGIGRRGLVTNHAIESGAHAGAYAGLGRGRQQG